MLMCTMTSQHLIGCVLLWFIPGEHLAMFFMDIYPLNDWVSFIQNMILIFIVIP